jgi:hypothetical protein
MVKVLPDPVTPLRVWNRAFSLTPLASRAIACPWSPAGEKPDTTLSFGTGAGRYWLPAGAVTSFTLRVLVWPPLTTFTCTISPGFVLSSAL